MEGICHETIREAESASTLCFHHRKSDKNGCAPCRRASAHSPRRASVAIAALIWPEMAPFLPVDTYNPATTPKPIISQFRKNTHVISIVFSGIYERVKI